MEGDETESSMLQSSVVSSVVMVDNKKKVESPGRQAELGTWNELRISISRIWPADKS